MCDGRTDTASYRDARTCLKRHDSFSIPELQRQGEKKSDLRGIKLDTNVHKSWYSSIVVSVGTRRQVKRHACEYFVMDTNIENKAPLNYEFFNFFIVNHESLYKMPHQDRVNQKASSFDTSNNSFRAMLDFQPSGNKSSGFPLATIVT